MKEIKLGDAVQLKSGGARMTVSKIFDKEGVPSALCDWQIGKKTQQAAYPLHSLTHA
jgi:uncharacterized protein YodC (DUF2158 family)